jgi:hypothetical protein
MEQEIHAVRNGLLLVLLIPSHRCGIAIIHRCKKDPTAVLLLILVAVAVAASLALLCKSRDDSETSINE